MAHPPSAKNTALLDGALHPEVLADKLEVLVGDRAHPKRGHRHVPLAGLDRRDDLEVPVPEDATFGDRGGGGPERFPTRASSGGLRLHAATDGLKLDRLTEREILRGHVRKGTGDGLQHERRSP